MCVSCFNAVILKQITFTFAFSIRLSINVKENTSVLFFLLLFFLVSQIFLCSWSILASSCEVSFDFREEVTKIFEKAKDFQIEPGSALTEVHLLVFKS